MRSNLAQSNAGTKSRGQGQGDHTMGVVVLTLDTRAYHIYNISLCRCGVPQIIINAIMTNMMVDVRNITFPDHHHDHDTTMHS